MDGGGAEDRVRKYLKTKRKLLMYLILGGLRARVFS